MSYLLQKLDAPQQAAFRCPIIIVLTLVAQTRLDELRVDGSRELKSVCSQGPLPSLIVLTPPQGEDEGQFLYVGFVDVETGKCVKKLGRGSSQNLRSA